jgi:hypothetical protein
MVNKMGKVLLEAKDLLRDRLDHEEMEHLDLEDTYNLLRRYVIGMKALAWFW